MSTLFPRTISAFRRTGSYVGGVWTASETAFTFTGSVQPTSGKDTEFLPEARRDHGAVKIYSDSPLNVSTEGSQNSGDVVVWAGRKWEVVTELVFANDVIPHYKYLASEMGAAT